jgi:hypothetical protein
MEVTRHEYSTMQAAGDWIDLLSPQTSEAIGIE